MSRRCKDEFITEQEVKEVNDFEGGIVVLDNMLDYNPTAIDPFY